MSNRLKYIIGKKILPNSHELLQQMASNMNFFGNSANNFLMEIYRDAYSEYHIKELANSINCNDNTFRIIESEDKNKIRVQWERNFFIKNILEEIVSPCTKTESDPKKIAIDFSSPNIAKPFHVGHLRSTIIGNFIANINTRFGNSVVKINYLGDWGTQFGLLKIGLCEKNIDSHTLKTNPINVLYSAYVHANTLAATDETVLEKARKYFSDVEQGVSDLSSWKEIREYTVNELSSTYQRLGVNFTTYSWESDYNASAIDNIINHLVDKNIIRTDELGRKVARVQNRDVVIMKSDNSSLYLSRDLAALLDRYEKYRFDKMLYVVDHSQKDHFTALFEIAERLDGSLAAKCQHVKFGRVKGMSSRKGTVVFLKDILNEARDKMYEKQLLSPNTRSSTLDDNTCDVLGVTAVIVNDLKQRRQRDYTFDWDRALQTEGDSGIKLQYLHCRLWSIEQNCGFTLPDECNPLLLQEPSIDELVAELARFEDVLNMSREHMEASYLISYMFKLARLVNKAIKNLRVISEEERTARQRLLIFHASRLVIKESLEILGIKPLNQM